MPPKGKEPSLDLKAPPISERAKRDFADAYAHPCRRDKTTGATLYYLGFSHRGHLVRRWDGLAWGPEFCVPALTIKKSERAAMPDGAEAPNPNA